MEIIKRIIMWIRSFLAWLFGKNKKTKNRNKNSEKLNKSKTNGTYNNTTLPPYMMIDDQGKLILTNNIQNIKRSLLNDDFKKQEIAKIIALISNFIDTNDIEEYLNKQDFDKLNNKKIDVLLDKVDAKIKEDVYGVINEYQEHSRIIKETIHNLDEITGYIKNNNISYVTSDLINDKLQNIKEDSEKKDEQTVLLDRKFFDTIKKWDKKIIHEVELEYKKVNYVTISNIMIDEIITKYLKIEEDYHNHRFNKSYYERELGKIKEQINFLRKIKNSKEVYEEITKLKKELYTKSKDKYDILYNNEIFLNINKKCDELLSKVNQKVIDIKKKENEKKKEEQEDENEKEKIKDEYIKKILLRFQDLNLSRELILLHKNRESEILDYSNTLLYLDTVYFDFIHGISDGFNFQRNKTKTELVKLYNDLNNIKSHIKNEEHIPIEHINFKMEDLVDAVVVRKNEVENMINKQKKSLHSTLVDEKIDQIKEQFLEKSHEKVLKKSN